MAGPELALCLTQGFVHPPSPQFCSLSQSWGQDPSLPTLLFSDPWLPVALWKEESVSEAKNRTQTLVIEFILVSGT